MRDQDFVRNAYDTVLVTASCPASGDSIPDLRFAQSLDSAGKYLSEPLIRNGGTPNFSDRILSCPAGGDVVISYTDAVYGTNAQWTLSETQTPCGHTRHPVLRFTNLGLARHPDRRRGHSLTLLNGSLPRIGQPLLYANSFNLYSTTTVKAIALKPGYLRSRVMTETYTRTPLPSRVLILDAAGIRFPTARPATPPPS